MKKRPLVMIIINYNDFPSTKRLLENVKEYKSLAKVLVVDNHSSDDSYQQLQHLKNNRIEIYQTKENKGFAYALNEGAKYIKKTYPACDIIFSNADIIIYSDQNVKELQQLLNKHHFGILAPVVYEQQQLNRGWHLLTPKQEILTNLPVIGKKFLQKYKTYQEEAYNQEITIVDVVSGCFFLMSSEVLEEAGYFDENTFLYYEENIMAQKLKDLGKQEAIANNITIIHDHSVSIDRSIRSIEKFKILKQSQYYYEKTYNQATKKQLRYLKLTANLTKLTLYLRLLIPRRRRKK